MKIKFSDHDRFLAFIMQRDVPWTGGEAGFAGRYTLGEALALEAFGKTHGTKDVAQLSRTPTFQAQLSRPILELLISVLTGGPNGGARGDVAAPIHVLVSRLRKLAGSQKAPEE